ncbi:MAG: PEP-CTERM sorting domain-containing protein [Fimbriimonadales bacterium]
MKKGFLVSLVFASVAGAQAGVGPTSEYYLTAGDQGMLWVVQGGAVNRSWVGATGGEYPIAVGNEVRTLAVGSQGAEYTLGGVDTGARYAFPTGIGSAWDGTTDLNDNYLVDWSNGGVWRTDRDWSNPSLLFALGGFGERLGITYDFSDNTLWVSGWDLDVVEHFGMDGTLLGSFAPGFTSITSLALDHADGTLWMGTQGQLGTFFQFAKDGTPLGSTTIAELATQNTLGGEFQAVPEPASIIALGVGLLLLARRRSR